MKKDGCPKGKIKMGGKCVPGYCGDVINYFGPTDDSTSAFWIMADGMMLDYMHHDEEFDHDAVGEFLPKPKFRAGDEAINEFMDNCNAIRLSDVSGMDVGRGRALNLEMYHKPTDEQIKTVTNILKKPETKLFVAERTSLDECSRGSEKKSCYYETHNPHPMDIQRFISRCWK